MGHWACQWVSALNSGDLEVAKVVSGHCKEMRWQRDGCREVMSVLVGDECIGG